MIKLRCIQNLAVAGLMRDFQFPGRSMIQDGGELMLGYEVGQQEVLAHKQERNTRASNLGLNRLFPV